MGSQGKPDFLTANEASLYLGLTRAQFDGKVKSGHLPTHALMSSKSHTRANVSLRLWRVADIEEAAAPPPQCLLGELNKLVRQRS